MPAIYINKTLSLAIGQKRITELLKINSSSSESESHSLSEDEELPHEAREVWKPNSQQKSVINKEKKAKSKIYKKKALGHYQKPQRIVEKPQNIISNDATTSKPNPRRRNNHVVEDTHHIIQEICPLATSGSNLIWFSLIVA